MVKVYGFNRGHTMPRLDWATPDRLVRSDVNVKIVD